MKHSNPPSRTKGILLMWFLVVAMAPRDIGSETSATHLFGMVLDPYGKPVTNAAVRVLGTELAGQLAWKRDSENVPFITTDREGRFALQTESSVDAVHVRLEAAELAPSTLKLRTHRDPVIRLKNGTSVKGRVTFHGSPVAGVGLVATPGRMGAWAGCDSRKAITDGGGYFEVQHLPLNVDVNIAGTLESVQAGKWVAGRVVRTAESESVVDVGEWPMTLVGPLAGTLVTRGSEVWKVPVGSRLHLIRSLHRERTTVPVTPGGKFEFPFAPTEVIALELEVPGFRFSGRNRSLNSERPTQVVGMWSGDGRRLTLLIESGDPLPPSMGVPTGGFQPLNEAIQGIE